MTQEVVAKQLYLSRHIIEEIEQQAFHPTVADVYRRGYVRSYARLLGLDEKIVLEAYKASQPSKKASSFFESTFMGHSNSPSILALIKRPSMLFVLMITVLVGVLLLGWMVDRWWQPSATPTALVVPITEGHAALTLPQQVSSEMPSSEKPSTMAVKHQSLALPEKSVAKPTQPKKATQHAVVASSLSSKPSALSLPPKRSMSPSYRPPAHTVP